MITNYLLHFALVMGTYSKPHKGEGVHLNEGTFMYVQAVHR